VDESVDGHKLSVIDAVGQYIDQSANLDSVILWVEEARGEPNADLTCFFDSQVRSGNRKPYLQNFWI
jgi:hypothetical protein